jgi:hypothetical protein
VISDRIFSVEGAWQKLLAAGAFEFSTTEDLEAGRVLFFCGAFAIFERLPKEMFDRRNDFGACQEMLAALRHEMETVILSKPSSPNGD